MTSLLPSEQQQLIVDTLGDVATAAYPDGLLAAKIATLWQSNATATSEQGQFLQTKRDAIDMLLGAVREQVNFADSGTSVELSNKATTLLEMRKAVVADLRIVLAQTQPAVTHAPVSGPLLATTPTTPPWGSADANGAVYRGDPYRRR